MFKKRKTKYNAATNTHQKSKPTPAGFTSIAEKMAEKPEAVPGKFGKKRAGQN